MRCAPSSLLTLRTSKMTSRPLKMLSLFPILCERSPAPTKQNRGRMTRRTRVRHRRRTGAIPIRPRTEKALLT